ncbi:MAG: TolC family protein [Elusimicrobiaceae bacterium]
MAAGAVLLLCPLAAADGGWALSLRGYLEQVSGRQQALTAARQTAKAARLLRQEKETEITPVLFSEASATLDNTPQLEPEYQGDSTKNAALTVGASLKTRHGVSGKLYYSVGRESISGTAFGDMDKWRAGQNLEISASLWRDRGGRETDSNLRAFTLGRDADAETAAFESDSIETRAEEAYWNLSAVKESLVVLSNNLKRARKLADWSRTRAEAGLADETEYLQAEAAAKLREQELLDATSLLLAAAREFNSFLGENSAETPALENADGPVSKPSAGVRADVRAAALRARAAGLAAASSAEQTKPTLSLFSMLSFSGLGNYAGSAASNAFSTTGPAATLGLRLGVPLAARLLENNRRGYALQAEAENLKYRQTLLDSEADRDALAQEFDLLLRRLTLAREIEKAQWEKYQAEERRRAKGKSTVYFTITFQDDYARAQISRIETALKLRILTARLKLYKE